MWNKKDNALVKEFTFRNFAEALAFVNSIGSLAEEHDHHPDIFLHDYKKVTITLTTHSAGGITEKDEMLARAIDAI